MLTKGLLTDEDLKLIEAEELSIEDDDCMKESGAGAAAAGGVFLAAAGWPSKSY